MTMNMMSPHSFTSPIEPYIAGVADMSYYMGSLAFYSLLLYRIYFIFKETELRLSRLTLAVMCVQVVISALAAIAHTVVITFYFHSWEDWVQRGLPATYVLMGNDLLLNGSLFLLFYVKLKEAIINIMRISHHRQGAKLTTGLFRLMAKHSVLFGICIITNQLFFVGVMLMAVTDLGHQHFSEGLMLILVLRATEDLINSLALCLVLKGNESVYRNCCAPCHSCTEASCRWLNGSHGLRTPRETMSDPFLTASPVAH